MSDEVVVSLTREEAEQFIRDSLKLDAHVLAKSGGVVDPSARRAEVRRKLRAAIKAA